LTLEERLQEVSKQKAEVVSAITATQEQMKQLQEKLSGLAQQYNVLHGKEEVLKELVEDV
jgi:chromosome segregation ATPase